MILPIEIVSCTINDTIDEHLSVNLISVLFLVFLIVRVESIGIFKYTFSTTVPIKIHEKVPSHLL